MPSVGVPPAGAGGVPESVPRLESGDVLGPAKPPAWLLEGRRGPPPKLGPVTEGATLLPHSG